MSTTRLSRRNFIAASTASAIFASTPVFAAGRKRRVALVGAGIRGTGFWGKYVNDNYGDVIEYVGLCDINPGRLEYALEYMGVDCPVSTDFDAMLAEAKPDLIIVTTVDSTHDEFIVKGLRAGLDVVTEKPMTTDETKCQAILDAAEASKGELIVALNYRYGIIFSRLKEHLLEEKIGRLTSIDFNWYLNTYHGASYFRRWHGLRAKGGTLLCHKAAHHFDLLNWWIDSEPVEVHAYGGLEHYGQNNPFRGKRCMDCPHAEKCEFFWDMTKDERLMRLYHANEEYDGYIRDNCLWRKEIDIFDKMAVQIRYANDVQVSYSLTTYSPYEGFRVAFNGMRGRMETWEGVPALDARRQDQSQQHAKEMDQTSHSRTETGPEYHDIITQLNFRDFERERVPYIRSGHWGGDQVMLDRIFRGVVERPELDHRSDVRDGAMSVLIGIAARKSIDEGRPVRIADLTSLDPA
jgi:predicted dehydrogenase